MEELGLMLLLWSYHVAIAAVLSAPIIFFGRKRVEWRVWELLAGILPFAAWSVLMFSDLRTKSLANLGEPFYFALGVPVGCLVRVGIGRKMPEVLVAEGLIAVMCVVAVAVYLRFPVCQSNGQGAGSCACYQMACWA
jgi:hypothetical protein